MNATRIVLPALTILAIAATVAFTQTPAATGTKDPIARGRYLVTAMGCNDCHTPWTMTAQGPAPDMTRMLSGHPADAKLPDPPAGSEAWPVSVNTTNTAWSGPWGISYTANLTPSKAHGLGAWTADEFLAALRTGRHQGRGRQILPPMPWPMISQLTDDDLRAVFAFLQSIPAIDNHVPEPTPPQGR
ncbi:MAG: c-type cytochrome [Planctomycetes bacterium]|nr:c-type cytochrome [Planctomycetota bacterium]